MLHQRVVEYMFLLPKGKVFKGDSCTYLHTDAGTIELDGYAMSNEDEEERPRPSQAF